MEAADTADCSIALKDSKLFSRSSTVRREMPQKIFSDTISLNFGQQILVRVRSVVFNGASIVIMTGQ